MIQPPQIFGQSGDGPRPSWLHVILVVLSALLLPVGLSILLATMGVRSPTAAGSAVSKIAMWYIGIAAVSLAVYTRTKHRSLWPAVLTFCGLMLVYTALFGAGLAFSFSRSRSAVRWHDLDAMNQRLIADVRAAAESGRAASELEPLIGRHTAEMERIGEGLTGDNAAALKIGVSFTRDMATITASYLGSIEPFKKAGGIQAETLPDKEAVVKRRRILQPALAFHAATLASMEKIPEDLRGRAAALGVQPDHAAKICAEMLGAMQFQRILKVQRLERDMLADMDAHLADLERLAPDWHITKGQFVFTAIGDKSLAAFNARVEKMKSLAAEQSTLQRQGLGVPDKP